MDRLESMRVFVAVITAGSFSGASRTLRMPIASVSRKVAELERHLKATLIVRSTRKLVLTETGKAYVEASKRILEDVSAAERSAAGEYSEPRGTLSMTAPVVFGRLHVVPIVTEFLKTYPKIDVRLALTDRSLDLLDDHVDLAVRIGHLPDSRLVALRLGEVRQVVCASPDYLKDKGIPKDPQDLASHDCISFLSLMGEEHWRFQGHSVPIRSRLVVNTAEAAIDAAAACGGITRVLSYQVATPLKERTLRIVLERFEPTPFPVNLIHAGETVMPAKCRAFIDFAVPRIRDRLSDGVSRSSKKKD